MKSTCTYRNKSKSYHHRRRQRISHYSLLCAVALLYIFIVGSDPFPSVNGTPDNTSCNQSNHPNSNLEKICQSNMSTKTYEQDGEEAREIAKYLPYFPFKGIPRFYDIGGFLEKPDVFQQIVDIFVKRYAEIGIDSVAG